MTILLKSPYPYFGGKSVVSAEIWRRLGDLTVYGTVQSAKKTFHTAHVAEYSGFMCLAGMSFIGAISAGKRWRNDEIYS